MRKEGLTLSEHQEQKTAIAERLRLDPTETTDQKLADRVSFLLTNQDRLEGEIKALKKKINQTDEDYSNNKYLDEAEPGISSEEPIMEDEFVEENSFELLETEFSFEEDNPAWQAEMADSISRIDELLHQLKVDSIQIGSHECRSNSCIVEYNFTDPETLYKIRPILKMGQASQSAFKEVTENGQRKLIAIYKH